MPHATPACVFGDCWRCPGYVEGGGLCEQECPGHTGHPSFVVEVGDPVEPPHITVEQAAAIPSLEDLVWHEPVGFATDEDIERWLDESAPVPTMLGAVMLCALVVAAVALAVPFVAWLSHVGGWTRAGVGAAIAAGVLAMAVKR